MKKITFLLFLISSIILHSQPTSYNWDRFGMGIVGMANNSPVNGFLSNTTQATMVSQYYLVEANSYANKYSNTNTPYNAEFDLFWGGGSFNGPNGFLTAATTTGKYYTMQVNGLAYSNRRAVIMETSSAPISFDATTPVSAIPTIYPGQDLSLTITLSGAKSSEEKAFIRYTDDGYLTSFVCEVTFSGPNDSSGSGTIPGAFNTAGKSVSFYVFTTTVSATDSSNHDLITLNLANNGGSNYSYAVEPFSPGDIAFVGFNADVDKDFAIVALADISANSTIYFTDNESDGSGGLTTGEGTITWTTGASIIKAGTVIVFTDLDSDANPNFGSSIGSINRSGAFNIGASKDGLLAFNGSDPNTPTSFIAGLQIGNDSSELGPFDGDGITLTNTDLVIGTSILVVDNSASPDGGIYTGSRSNQTSYSDYYSLLGDNSTNWSTSTTDGESFLPFSEEAFTINSTNWTGSVSSVWNLAGNWDNGIPTTSSLAAIPDVSTSPIISSGTDAQAGNIVINSGENLTVNSSNSLTVTGLLTSESGSSLIVNGTLTGKIKYNRTLTTTNWYLVAAPISGQDMDAFVSSEGLATGIGNNLGFAPYVNDGTAWDYYQSGASGTGNFVAGKGYSVKLATTGDIAFTGAMLTTDVTGLTLTDNSGGSGNAFNLMGNPYPSFIAANTNANGINNVLDINSSLLTEETIWLWDQATSSYDQFNQIVTYHIAPGQGFFVSASGASSLFAITEAMQSHQSSDSFQRNASTRPEIQLVMSDGTTTRDADIFYISGTTTGFDNGYDSSIFGGVENSFAVYTHAVANGQGRDLGIQSLPDSNYENMVIPVGVNAVSGSNLSFTVNVQNLPGNLKVILEDTQTNTFTQLNIVNGEYSITLNNDLSGIGRFYLHTTSQTLGVGNMSLDYISIYTTEDNDILNIVGLQDGKTSVRLYDLTGKRILDSSFHSNRVNTVALPELTSGIYIVQLQSESGSLNKKIMID